MDEAYITRLRTLARKSILGFGYSDVRDLSIEQLFGLKKISFFVGIYYGLDKISFADDILDELRIEKKDRIEKPGKLKVPERYKKINEIVSKYHEGISEEERMHGSSRAKSFRRKSFRRKSKIATRSFHSKSKNRNYNHGHRNT